MTENSPTGYSAEAVQQQIERDRRRHRISKKEERLIHALLKGSASNRPPPTQPSHSDEGCGPMAKKP
ncbi:MULTISPECIES: hypothetical protein [Sphingobium]|uniref:hypothetical protein n=1 Tax=Sphingobium TaxID=165695 RepID=UPI003016928A